MAYWDKHLFTSESNFLILKVISFVETLTIYITLIHQGVTIYSSVIDAVPFINCTGICLAPNHCEGMSEIFIVMVAYNIAFHFQPFLLAFYIVI